MPRSLRRLVLSLFLIGSLVPPAFADDALGLESWQERADEGNFAQEIAGVYLIRHHTDEGAPGSPRLISLTAGGNWSSTYANQDALFNLSGTLLPPEDGVSGNDLPDVDIFAPSTLFNPARFSDQHGVWARSGWREMTAEVLNFNLAAVTGVQTGSARVRYVVRFSKDWQSIRGTQRGWVYARDQDPLDPEAVPALAFDSHFSGQRVTVEAE